MGRLTRIKEFANSLTGRMALGVLLTHALLAPLLFGGLLFIVKTGYQAQFINQVRTESRLLATIVEQNLPVPDFRARIDDLLLGHDMAFAQIIKPDGSNYYTSANSSSKVNFQEDFFFGQHDDAVYYIAIPLYTDDGQLRATLRLGYNESPTQEQINTAYQRAINLGLIYIALTLALVTFSGLQVTRSLRRLRNAAHKVVLGDTTRQLDVTTSVTEVTSLGQDLERMRSQLVRQGEMLEHQALHDALTGLPNRILLHDRMQQAISGALRGGKAVALFLMDLDRFKEINDGLGHHFGDVLLQKVALRLRGALRESDTVARLGGDEFAILLPVIDDQQHAELTAQKLLHTLEKPIVTEGHTLIISGSIGIALFPQHGEDIAALMRRADMAMYKAKRAHSGYALYHPDLDQRMLGELTLAGELRLAIERGELLVHYQPKIDLKSGMVTSAEALVRWQHPHKGLLAPEHFLPLAEKNGLIKSITLWVLQEALQQCRRWDEAGLEIPVAVNVSAHNLQTPDLPEYLGQLLKDTGVQPSWLELEINESTILTDPARTLEMLKRLHQLGLAISIDDYGTASASLHYLNRLPTHQIKIDKSFILNIADQNNAMIVQAAIALAHSLGRTAIAEGVESKDVLDKLAALGCDMAQGYYMSPPVAPDQLIAWLKSSPWKLQSRT